MPLIKLIPKTAENSWETLDYKRDSCIGQNQKQNL